MNWSEVSVLVAIAAFFGGFMVAFGKLSEKVAHVHECVEALKTYVYKKGRR